MKLVLQYSFEAAEDLVAIWRHVASDNMSAADRLLDTIESGCDRLRDFPHMGPSREDLRSGFRMLVITGYVVLYRALEDRIQIVRVVHGSRDLDALLPE